MTEVGDTHNWQTVASLANAARLEQGGTTVYIHSTYVPQIHSVFVFAVSLMIFLSFFSPALTDKATKTHETLSGMLSFANTHSPSMDLQSQYLYYSSGTQRGPGDYQ